MTGTILSKRELKTLFYVGRKLELIGCYVPMKNGPEARTVKAHRSYGYDMEKPDGRVSRLDFAPGMKIEAFSDAGNGYTEVVIWDGGSLGLAAAHYRLL